VCQRAHAALAPMLRTVIQACSLAGALDGRYPSAGQPGRRASAHADWPVLTAEQDVLSVQHAYGLSRCGRLLATAGWDSANVACSEVRAAE